MPAHALKALQGPLRGGSLTWSSHTPERDYIRAIGLERYGWAPLTTADPLPAHPQRRTPDAPSTKSVPCTECGTLHPLFPSKQGSWVKYGVSLCSPACRRTRTARLERENYYRQKVRKTALGQRTGKRPRDSASQKIEAGWHRPPFQASHPKALHELLEAILMRAWEDQDHAFFLRQNIMFDACCDVLHLSDEAVRDRYRKTVLSQVEAAPPPLVEGAVQ